MSISQILYATLINQSHLFSCCFQSFLHGFYEKRVEELSQMLPRLWSFGKPGNPAFALQLSFLILVIKYVCNDSEICFKRGNKSFLCHLWNILSTFSSSVGIPLQIIMGNSNSSYPKDISIQTTFLQFKDHLSNLSNVVLRATVYPPLFFTEIMLKYWIKCTSKFKSTLYISD